MDIPRYGFETFIRADSAVRSLYEMQATLASSKLTGLTRGLLCLCCFGLLPNLEVAGQGIDSFEGGDPRWLLVESDCQASLESQGMSLIAPHGGQTSELIELSCGHGTQVLLAYPVEPCAILNEFTPGLWTRCSSSRIQIGVRVIFPFAAHPVTEGRLTTILWGDSYANPGSWQEIRVRELGDRIEAEKVAMRQRYGSKLKLEGAYIDALVLNAYTGPGRYRMQIDDLRLRGMIPMAATGNPPPADWRQRWQWRYTPKPKKNTFWAAPNLPPLWLQHRNEPLPWIKALGFAGIVTEKLPSQETLLAANRIELGVISPPPRYALEFDPQAAESLRGWLLGAALDSRQVSLAQKEADQVASFPAELRRPLLVEAMEGFFQYSRVADELIIPMPVATSATSPQDKVRWLNEKLEASKQRSLGWVSVNMGVPPSLANQLELAANLTSVNSDASVLQVNPQVFRHQVIQAFLAGARGVLLRTFRPLDVQNAADSAQVAALRRIQHDLKLWGPWLAAGQPVAAPWINQTGWAVGSWQLEDGQLVLAKVAAEEDQFCVTPTRGLELEFELPSNLSNAAIFRITENRLERVLANSTPVGYTWKVTTPAPIESFVVTSNPQVLQYLRRQMELDAVDLAADMLELATHEIGHATRLATALQRSSPTQPRRQGVPTESQFQTELSEAQRLIDSGSSAIRTNQPAAAIRQLLVAQDAIARILRNGFDAAAELLSDYQASPLISTTAGLHLHWKIADACQRSVWETRPIPAGDFASLPAMEQSGWSQQRRLEDKVDLRVELVPHQAIAADLSESGKVGDLKNDSKANGLRLAAYTKNAQTQMGGGFEGASLRVRSAATKVKAGQLVRVSGTARVLAGSSIAGVGLLLYDNQMGPSFGQLIDGQPGANVPIELYRFAVSDGEFRLLAECRGECDVIIDSLRMDVVTPATNDRNFGTMPLNKLLFEPPDQIETIFPSSAESNSSGF
ncbi:MAG: hypothetical protein ACE361_08290 [Aureliella sp.]